MIYPSHLAGLTSLFSCVGIDFPATRGAGLGVRRGGRECRSLRENLAAICLVFPI